MKVKISEFKPLAQFILKSEFDTIHALKDNQEDVKKSLETRPFDVDFDIKQKKDKEKDEFIIELRINNKKTRKAGYKIGIEAAFFYKIKGFEKMEHSLQDQYIFYTALPMAINHIRYYIATMTAEGIYGKYTLPGIDLKDLIQNWIEKQDKKN